MPNIPSSDERWPHLDALRAFAVACVLYSHYFLAGPLAKPVGAWGVRLFFVLSGFLITGILLRARDAAPGTGTWPQLRTFYLRRALRIFPAYYAYLALAALAGAPDVRRAPVWHALYLSNVHLVRIDDWPAWTSHLWSLSVEEQFYLAWPFVMLLAPRRALGAVIGLTIAVGPLSRWLLRDVSDVAVWTMPFAMLDSLGVGALLAWARWRGHGAWAARALRIAALPMAASTAVLLFFWRAAERDIAHLWQLTLALVFGWLVTRATEGWRGWTSRVLAAAPVRYVGRVSYGVYLYHLLGQHVVLWSIERSGLPWPSRIVLAGLSTLVTLGIASVSWVLLERPLNALKSRVPYPRATRLATSRAPFDVPAPRSGFGSP